jgi:hypothetical protein
MLAFEQADSWLALHHFGQNGSSVLYSVLPPEAWGMTEIFVFLS